MPKPDIDTYLTFWASLDETDRMDFTAEALEIARAEKLNLLNADMWETLGWVFADRASSPADRDVAVTGVCLAAAMFAQAEHVRNPGPVS